MGFNFCLNLTLHTLAMLSVGDDVRIILGSYSSFLFSIFLYFLLHVANYYIPFTVLSHCLFVVVLYLTNNWVLSSDRNAMPL